MIFSHIPSFYPLDASNNRPPPTFVIVKSLQTLKNVPWGVKLLGKNQWFSLDLLDIPNMSEYYLSLRYDLPVMNSANNESPFPPLF